MKAKGLAKLMTTFLVIVLLAGCGGGKGGNSSQVRIGVLTAVNFTSEEFSAALKNRDYAVQLTPGQGGAAFDYSEDFRDRLEGAELTVVYYDTLSSMLMGLQTGDIEAFALSKTAADYLSAQNPAFKSAVPVTKDGDRTHTFNIDFSLLLSEENAALRDELNAAVAAINGDGTLNRLRTRWIYDLIGGEEPEACVFEQFPGAETIRVAVTGDLPPLDYIAADGTPAGFNTALLAELSSRLGKNIELVSIDSGARAAALAGGVVDVVFWARSIREEGNADDALAAADIPDGTIVSEPYFVDMAAVVFPAG